MKVELRIRSGLESLSQHCWAFSCFTGQLSFTHDRRLVPESNEQPQILGSYELPSSQSPDMLRVVA